MTQKALKNVLDRHGVLQTNGHFVLTSEKHSDSYFDKETIISSPFLLKFLGTEIALEFATDQVDAVFGPAVGGAILACSTTQFFQENQNKRCVWTGFTSNDQLRHGHERTVDGKRVLVVEDVMTTGDSVRKTISAIRQHGGEFIGVGTICNRGEITAEQMGVPKLVSLVELQLEAWDVGDCPLCGVVPINETPGHGREFVARQAAERL